MCICILLLIILQRKQSLCHPISEAPRFTSPYDQPARLIAEVGDDVSFSCVTEAIPPAQVTWYLNGEVLDGTWITILLTHEILLG